MSESRSVKVSIRDGTVTIELPLRLVRERLALRRGPKRRPGRSAIAATRGMWRNRKVDGLAFQRKAREEWRGRPSE